MKTSALPLPGGSEARESVRARSARFLLLFSLAALAPAPMRAQPVPAALADRLSAPSSEYKVIGRGPHHAVWARTIAVQVGHRTVYRTNSYIELATSMNYMSKEGPNAGQWVEAREEIEAVPGGAVARQGQTRVTFANDAATPGAIDLETPDGKRLRSHVIGLSMSDSTGKSVLIAQVKTCQGEILPPNQVIYRDCMTDVRCSIRYTYSKAGLEQDLIIEESLPMRPEDYGLDSVSARLELITEFLDCDAPGQIAGAVATSDGATLRDETLDFGSLKIGPGRAYALGKSLPDKTLFVAKQWARWQDRQFLVEQLSLRELLKQLDGLPRSQGASFHSATNGLRHVVSTQRRLPPPVMAKKSQPGSGMLLATAGLPARGFLWDYAILSSQTNFVAKAGTTYYVSGNVLLSGSNVFEGGTVFKHGVGTGIILQPTETTPAVTFLGSPYKPIIFTAKDDDTVGEPIAGSTASPTGYYANPALTFNVVSPSDRALAHLRFSFAKRAIGFTYMNANVSDSQFINCQEGIGGTSGTIGVLNSLFCNTATNLITDTCCVGYAVRNVTFSGSACLAAAPSGSPTTSVSLLNCILANVTNLFAGAVVSDGDYNAFYQSPSIGSHVAPGVASWPFQTVGAGQFYLADASPYRDFGTTNVDAGLLAELRRQTTYPPVLLSNVASTADTVLWPVAQRDADSPDLGYHYDPIDYFTYVYSITNATLTITNGTVIAYPTHTGIWLQDRAQIVSEGSPLARNVIVHYSFVQEQSVKIGTYALSGAMPLNPYRSAGQFLPGIFRFTDFISPACNLTLLYDAVPWAFNQLELKDSSLVGGQLIVGGGWPYTVSLTNNLFEGGTLYCEDTPAVTLYNNLLRFSSVTFDRWDGLPWIIKDNVFDGCDLAPYSSLPLDHCYNAYINTARLEPTNVTDVVLTNFFYATGALGRYYQVSTNLLNRGSRTADLAGLYHYTVQTNLLNGLQIKETNSVVDIGLHYVACDAVGKPIDTDGDGLPDYWEDRNGNGTADSGETDWRIYDSQNRLCSANPFTIFTPLR